MKLAAMQPYFLPYLAYWQLLSAVDKFVVLDDVNYINKGWINRNRILLNGKDYLFTIPLKEASQNKKIKEIEVDDNPRWRNKFIKTLTTAYKKAPEFDVVMHLLNSCLDSKNSNLSSFITNSLKKIACYLDIKTKIADTSEIYNTGMLKKDEKIIAICQKERVTNYINPVGGAELYDKDVFMKKGISLSFLKMKDISYKQYNGSFIPCLSITDVLMFNKKETVKHFLNEYDLI